MGIHLLTCGFQLVQPVVESFLFANLPLTGCDHNYGCVHLLKFINPFPKFKLNLYKKVLATLPAYACHNNGK